MSVNLSKCKLLQMDSGCTIKFEPKSISELSFLLTMIKITIINCCSTFKITVIKIEESMCYEEFAKLKIPCPVYYV